MFQAKLMVSGLRRQANLLNDLIDHLEGKPTFDHDDSFFYETRTREVASNLQKLRKIKRAYFEHRN